MVASFNLFRWTIFVLRSFIMISAFELPRRHLILKGPLYWGSNLEILGSFKR